MLIHRHHSSVNGMIEYLDYLILVEHRYSVLSFGVVYSWIIDHDHRPGFTDFETLILYAVLVLVTVALLYEEGPGAREREITLTASALNRRTSVHPGTASCSLIASSSSFIASSI